jgi:microcystin-dependent protein
MDNSLRSLDTAYGGCLSLSLSGGTHQLTVAEASNPILNLSGTLSSDQYLYFPPIAGKRIIVQGVNLNGHLLYVRGNNGSDVNGVYFWTSFGIPYGLVVLPWRVHWDYGSVNPGTIIDVPVGWIGNGWLPCDGRYVIQALHDILYDVVGGTWGISGGSFKLPDYRGTVLAMADQVGTLPGSGPLAVNEGNRGILYSWGVGINAGGEATHTLSAAEMPSHNHGDSGHGHGVYDPQHAHGYTQATNFNLYGGQYPSTGAVSQSGATTGASPTYISIYTGYANISYAGGSGGHNNVQPTSTTIKMIRW